MKRNFIKKTYAPFTALYLVFYIIFVAMFVFLAFKRQKFPFRNIVFLSGMATLFIPAYLLDIQGVYIKEDGLYYQTWIRRKIDIEKIAALIIIKAEVPTTNSTYSPIDDNKGNNLFSVIALAEIDGTMKYYPYGDKRFVSKYRKNIIFQTIYDDTLIEYITKHKSIRQWEGTQGDGFIVLLTTRTGTERQGT